MILLPTFLLLTNSLDCLKYREILKLAVKAFLVRLEMPVEIVILQYS